MGFGDVAQRTNTKETCDQPAISSCYYCFSQGILSCHRRCKKIYLSLQDDKALSLATQLLVKIERRIQSDCDLQGGSHCPAWCDSSVGPRSALAVSLLIAIIPSLPAFDEIFMPLLCSQQVLLISCVNVAIFSLDKWNVDCC